MQFSSKSVHHLRPFFTLRLCSFTDEVNYKYMYKLYKLCYSPGGIQLGSKGKFHRE